ncbi:MAG: hypothetical protein ABIC40_05080, partial [bacterium]
MKSQIDKVRARIIIYAIIFFGLSLSVLTTGTYASGENPPLTPEELIRLTVNETKESIIELFINVSSWDVAHEALRKSSRDELVRRGFTTASELVNTYILSVDIRDTTELDRIIQRIGNDATQYLIPYLKNENPKIRRHAANLIGVTCAVDEYYESWASASADPAFTADRPSIEALKAALKAETDRRA